MSNSHDPLPYARPEIAGLKAEFGQCTGVEVYPALCAELVLDRRQDAFPVDRNAHPAVGRPGPTAPARKGVLLVYCYHRLGGARRVRAQAPTPLSPLPKQKSSVFPLALHASKAALSAGSAKLEAVALNGPLPPAAAPTPP